jgi:monoamine oxidase
MTILPSVFKAEGYKQSDIPLHAPPHEGVSCFRNSRYGLIDAHYSGYSSYKKIICCSKGGYMNSSNEIGIAIVGAGIAGLNAALTLQDAGMSCEIYEASDRVGGRMHSDSMSWADGQVSEWCGEFIDSDHSVIRGLARRFGLPLIDLGRGKGDRTQSVLYLGNHYYTGEELARDFGEIYPVLDQQMKEVGFPTTHTHFTKEGHRLDHLSVFDWVERYVKGGHGAPVGRMLDNACTGFFGLDSRLQSSLNLLYMFGPQAEEDDEDEEEMGPMQGSSRIAGGNERLPKAIANSLPEGSIHLKHRLEAIARENGGNIRLTFATPNEPLEVICKHVILTLPFSTLRHIDYKQAGFDELKQVAITQLGYGTISKLFLQFDTRYWYEDGPWPRSNNGFIITDLDIQTLWDSSIGQPGNSGLLVNYTSGHRGAAFKPPAPYTTTESAPEIEVYVQRCLEQLEHVFPGISKHYLGKGALSYSTGDPHLLGSYACWRVGQYTQFAGYERVRQGNIHFAGEHCSVEFQGFMEGAAREGERAACEILENEGLNAH